MYHDALLVQLVSALNSIASLSYRHRTLHASLARHLLRNVLSSDFPRVEALIYRCTNALGRASTGATHRSSAKRSSTAQQSQSSCTSGDGASSEVLFRYTSSNGEARDVKAIAGNAKPLPRNVHLPPPMFYDSSSNTGRLKLFPPSQQQQVDSSQSEYPHHQEHRERLLELTAGEGSDHPERINTLQTLSTTLELPERRHHLRQGIAPPCVRERVPMMRELQGGSNDACVVVDTAVNSLQQEEDSCELWKHGEENLREKNAFPMSNSRHGIGKKHIHSRTEARALKAAAQILPGRVNPSVAAALLQACAAVGHRNMVLLSCLMASLKVAMLQEQENFPIPESSYSAAPAVGEDRGKAAVSVIASALTSAPLLASTRLCCSDDPSHPTERKNDLQSLNDSDHHVGALSRPAASETVCSADAHDQAYHSITSPQLQQPADEGCAVPSILPGEGSGCLTPLALEMIMSGKNSTAKEAVNYQTVRRCSFIGLHEIRGLVFQSPQPPEGQRQGRDIQAARRSSSPIIGPAAISKATTWPSGTGSNVQADHAFTSLTLASENNASAEHQRNFNLHTPPKNTVARLRYSRPVDSSERTATATTAAVDSSERTAKEALSSSKEDLGAQESLSQNPVASTSHFQSSTSRHTATDTIDARQMQDLQLIATQVAQRTVKHSTDALSAFPETVFLASSQNAACVPRSPERRAGASGKECGSVGMAFSGASDSTQEGREGSAVECSNLVLTSFSSISAGSTSGSQNKSTDAAPLCFHNGHYVMTKDVNKESACLYTQDNTQERSGLAERGRCSSSGMVRFQYDARFFQRLRRAALLSQGRDLELEELKNECKRQGGLSTKTQGLKTIGKTTTLSKSGRIARVTSLVPANSHVMRRVSAEEIRHRFWERLFKGRRHPQARRLFHRRLFRIACKLSGLDLLGSQSLRTWEASEVTRPGQRASTSINEDSVCQSEEGPHPYTVHYRAVTARLTTNYYRTAQVVRQTMKRWRTLRRSFLAPYQSHARLIQKEMRFMQQDAPKSLAVLDSTHVNHRSLSTRGCGTTPANSGPSCLFMYFLPAPATTHTPACNHHSQLPFLVDTQLLLPPKIETKGRHWLARSRLRCLYSRILRDHGRSQNLIKERDGRSDRPAAGVAEKGKAIRCNLRRGPVRGAAGEAIPSICRNENLPTHPVAFASSAVKPLLLLNDSHSIVPPEVPTETQLYKSTLTSERGYLEEESRCQQHRVTELSMHDSTTRTQANAAGTASIHHPKSEGAIEVCKSGKGEIPFHTQVSAYENLESEINERKRARPLTWALADTQPSREEFFNSCGGDTLKHVPLLREASTALHAAIKLQFFPSGLLYFFVSHIYWAIRMLARAINKSSLFHTSAATAARVFAPTIETAFTAALTCLPNTEQHSCSLALRAGKNPSINARGSMPNPDTEAMSLSNTFALTPPHSSHVVNIQLLCVLRSLNAAAAAVLAAMAACTAKSASAMTPSAAGVLTRDRVQEAAPQSEPARRAAPPTGSSSPTATVQQSQQTGTVIPTRYHTAAPLDLSYEESPQERKGSPTGNVLSRREAGALCTMLEACYRSIAFRSLLTSRRTEAHAVVREHEDSIKVVLDSVNSYTALLQSILRRKSDQVLGRLECREEVSITFSSKPSRSTPVDGVTSQKLNLQKLGSPGGGTTRAKEDAEQLVFPCSASNPGHCSETHPESHSSTMRELVISRTTFCAVVTRYIADVVGIPSSFPPAFLVACANKLNLHSSLPGDRGERQRECADEQHATGDCHDGFPDGERAKRDGLLNPACCIDVTTSNAPSVSQVPATNTSESAAARQISDLREGYSIDKQANKLQLHNLCGNRSQLSGKTYTDRWRAEPAGGEQNGCKRSRRYPLTAARGTPLLQLSTEQMSTLLRTVLMLNELPSGNDAATAVLLGTLRKVLSQKLKRVICCDGGRLARDSYALHSPYGTSVDTDDDQASTVIKEANISTTRRGESRRVLLTALVALTLHEISGKSNSREYVNKEVESNRPVLTGGKGVTGAAEVCRHRIATHRIDSSYPPDPQEAFERKRHDNGHLLECVIARISCMGGVPHVLLRKLVEREFARHG